MLVLNPVSGFTLPCTTRLGSWQARHNCAFELSITRKFCAILSVACTCGLWQLVHSTFRLISFTLPVVSAVLPCDTSDATRSGESFIGTTRLNGWEPVKFVPNASMSFIVPMVGSCPYAAVFPTATVPSWQLRQRLLVTPRVGRVWSRLVSVVLV